MKKKILVTGGGGFIGSHLVEALVKKGHKVKALVEYNTDNTWGWIDSFDPIIKKSVEVISGDIRDQNLVIKLVKNVDIIFHLAALISIPYSYISPRSYISTNIIGTLNLLEAIKASNVELFVQTSTSEVYGSSQYFPIDEKHPLNAQSPYAASKIGSDQLALSYNKSFNLPVTIIRPFNTFGPRQSLRAFIPTIITQIVSNKKIIKLGNLSSKRDFSYVSDTVKGFINCIENKRCLGKSINLGTGMAFSMQETLDIIIKEIGKKANIEIEKKRLRPKKSEVDHLLSSNILAKKLINWEPVFKNKNGFRKGLQKTIDWFSKSENIKLYKSDLYNL
jgi:NAD dependent epimerase/dehydratase